MQTVEFRLRWIQMGLDIYDEIDAASKALDNPMVVVAEVARI